MNTKRNNLIAWAIAGSLAYIICDYIHEEIGHNLVCSWLGGRMTLISSAYFKCEQGDVLIDIGGPNLQSIVTEHAFGRRDFVYPFLFAAVFAFLVGRIFSMDGLPSAIENLLEMAASAPILLLRFKYSDGGEPFKPGPVLIIVTCIVWIIFCATLGHGGTISWD